MSYYISKTVKGITFQEGIEKVTEQLKTEGFGILTTIDFKATMKKKLDVDLYNYVILGACNPQYAYKAVQEEDKIGTMLPCNVIVQERNAGEIEITAVDPMASMQSVENDNLGEIATEIKNKLENVISSL